jgi:hypothetical protein
MEMDKKMQEADRRAATWTLGALIVGAGPSGLVMAACLAASRPWCWRCLTRWRPHGATAPTTALRSTSLPRFCELLLLPFPEDYWTACGPSAAVLDLGLTGSDLGSFFYFNEMIFGVGRPK